MEESKKYPEPDAPLPSTPLTYIMLGVSKVKNTFCIIVSAQLRKGTLIITGDFPYTIKDVYGINIDRKILFDIISQHSSCLYGKKEGNTIFDIDLCYAFDLHEFILQIASKYPNVCVNKVDMNSEHAKEAVDLSELSAGVNWILLSKKERPEVVSFM